MKQKSIKAGDLMLLQSPHIEVSGKLEPKWVGPFLVTKKTRPGSFYLADTKGRVPQHY
jgi:hypothetical protein